MAVNTRNNIVTNGLVLYMDASNRMSYVSGSTTWNDLSGFGDNGTLTNGPTFSNLDGGSISFDGVDDYVNIPTSTDTGNPNTICAFINVSVITGANQVIYGPSANGSDNWFSISNNRVQLLATQVSDINNFAITGNTIIQVNTWYYLTGIVNNNTTSIYINGRVEAVSSPQAFTIGGWNSTARIGQRATGQFPFNGRIACLQGYNRALSQQEIIQNYNATKARFGLL
jgi:hypothetical protein